MPPDENAQSAAIFGMSNRRQSWFKGRVPVSRQPLHNVLWLASERTLRIGLTGVVLALVARHLQPAGFGELAFASSFTGLFTPLAFCGLDAWLVSELVRRPGQGAALLGTAALLRLAAGAISAVVCVALAFALPGLRSGAWFILPLSLGLLWQSAEVTDVWFQRHLQSRRTALARFTAVVLGAAVKVWLVWRGAPAVWFAWAVLGDVVFFEFGLLLAYARMPDKPGRWRFDPALARTLLRQGAPLALAGLLLALQARLDQFIVKAALPDTATGDYFAAVRIVELPLFLTGAIGLSIFPAFAASLERGEHAFAEHAQRLFDLLNGFAWLAALGITVFGPWAVPRLLGPAYAGAVGPLLVLAWGLVPWAGSFARQQCILAGRPTWLQMVAALVGIGAQGAFAAALVPRFGGPGAALAAIIANVISGWLTSFVLPGLQASARWQGRAFLIPFAPRRWRAAAALLR